MIFIIDKIYSQKMIVDEIVKNSYYNRQDINNIIRALARTVKYKLSEGNVMVKVFDGLSITSEQVLLSESTKNNLNLENVTNTLSIKPKLSRKFKDDVKTLSSEK